MNSKQTEQDYVPYGPKWEKEMSKFPKPQLIKMLGKTFRERQEEKLIIPSLPAAKPVSEDVHQAAMNDCVCKTGDCSHYKSFIHGAGYAAAPAKGMKWVKASDRLPNTRGKYWIRFHNLHGEIKTGSLFDGFKFPHHKSEIEWLDESPSDSEAGDGWIWTDTLACEWAGYLESKLKYSSVQHIPQLLAQWKQSKFPAAPIQKTVK